MQAYTHGIQVVDFVNDQGERIEGHRLYIGYRDEKVAGQRTEKLFVKKGFPIPKESAPGAVIDLSFDINKRLDKLQVISALPRSNPHWAAGPIDGAGCPRIT